MNLPCLSFRLQTSFLLLITLSNTDTQTVPADQKPFALLCVGCALIASSVLLLLKSLWKAKFKSSKLPARRTVLLMEFLVSLGSAVLTIVAMPHLDIVTNVTILNSVAVLSAVLQVAAQCAAKERNRFIFPSLIAFLLILLGYVLFLVLYLLENESRSKTAVWAGLAVAGSFLISLNWWENYIRLFCDTRSDGFLKVLCEDMRRCQNVLHILSSLLRILVTGCVVGAYVPLSQMDWVTLTTVPNREMRIVVTLIVVQLVSSALCQWFAVAACKMHALRRCFILPLYSASLAVMAVLIIPVIIYFEDYRAEVSVADNSTFTDYCTYRICFKELYAFAIRNSTFVILTDKWPNVNIVMSYNFALGLAAAWWLGLVLATLHIWFFKVHRIQRTQDLFIRRLYEGAFIEQSLLLNTLTVYLCATMWHETGDEMMNIIISIFRLDQYRPKTDAKNNDINIEAHIYFDDAFKDVRGSRGRHVNEYAETLVETIKNVYRIPDQRLFRTPYGGRLEVTMPKGNNLVVHFKDKQLIRHKKRWSQIMYLYYLLGWKLKAKYFTSSEKEKDEAELKSKMKMHNTYILALDGDTDFHPAAVMLLIDRLKMYPLVGAACGRIHPTGSGPMVWFQKFEYAVGHWLQKAAEHVIGCVLCSPGCFSLFRAAALMDNNVMKTYLTKSTEARHYIQYDQGEDRWLCTLLLKQGWRVEYNAASDAYTNAPEEFKEFYNQRRRWTPSTMANIVDLLGSTNIVAKRNKSMSKLYLLYHLFSMASSVLGPATICLMLAGSFTFLLNIDGSSAVVLAVIPPAIYLGLCFKVKSNTQITIAAVLSVFYAFLMLVVGLTIISSMVKEQTILTPSSIFVIAMSILYLITGLMHPQEFSLVFYGFLYILCIPSAYLLLAIYSMVNMNNVSWGTRETAPAPGAARPAAATPQTRVQQGRRPFCISFQDETEFFGELQAKYLYPLPEDKEKQKKITNDLRELRNKITFAYFICNALWLVATFTLQFLQANIFIRFPKVTVDLELTEEFITVEPIGFMFILGFALLILIQFLAMLYHRFYTLIHFVAFEGTESRTSKTQSKQVYSTSITTTAITAIAHFFNKSVLVIYSIIIMISIFLRSRILKSMTPMRFCSQTC
uniref:chitin synthase n=1 Tax=Myripristis murdjan TaxID=586833 RepID=A0A667X713_9TELE